MEQTFLRLVLGLYGLASFAISLAYLRYRRVTVSEYAFWGTLALAIPVLGPFLVIAARPGPRKRVRRPGKA